jgi:hypothetical protein
LLLRTFEILCAPLDFGEVIGILGESRFAMKIAISFLMFVIVVASANFGAAQQPSAAPAPTATQLRPPPPSQGLRPDLLLLRSRRLVCAFYSDALIRQLLSQIFATVIYCLLAWRLLLKSRDSRNQKLAEANNRC